MQTLVRQATDADLAAILPLCIDLMETHARIDSRYRLAPDAAAQGKSHLRAELATPNALLTVAERDATLVGYCRASIRQSSSIFERGTHGFVSELHVAPAHRRCGVGASLFWYAREWFTERGITRIELVTLHANADSRAFWENVGCQPYAEHRCLELPGASE